MGTTRLPSDFKEFLKLLHSEGVEYLLVGGHAVGYHGHPRTTGDMDIWVARTPENARRIVKVLRAFGFASTDPTEDMFLKADQVVRMGVPPVRIEILTSISGVDFDECFAAREAATLDGVSVNMISRRHLLTNKRASSRPKDNSDIQALERAQ